MGRVMVDECPSTTRRMLHDIELGWAVGRCIRLNLHAVRLTDLEQGRICLYLHSLVAGGVTCWVDSLLHSSPPSWKGKLTV